MPRISIEITDEEIVILEKRAKHNLLTLKEQIEDTVRRSAVNYNSGKSRRIKVDDPLVDVFSRQKSGRKKKAKKK